MATPKIRVPKSKAQQKADAKIQGNVQKRRKRTDTKLVNCFSLLCRIKVKYLFMVNFKKSTKKVNLSPLTKKNCNGREREKEHD